MLMPFQVTMVSSYLVLNMLGLIDTVWAVILPGAASTLPVFIMTRFFMDVPEAVMEAAAVDGASSFQTFLRFGLPLGAPGHSVGCGIGVFGILERNRGAAGILEKNRRSGRCHYICQTSQRITPGYH